MPTRIDAPRGIAYRGGVPSDRIDREIEEILSRMDEDEPISLEARRRRPRARQPLGARAGAALALPSVAVTPTGLLFTGAGVMLAGIVLARVWEPLIWAAFAGVALFVAAFVWALARPRRTRRRGDTASARGGYWRGRYVEYEPSGPGVLKRIRRAFRRR